MSDILYNKYIRESAERAERYKDPKQARELWRILTSGLADMPAKPIYREKKGEQTEDSIIEYSCYNSLCEELKASGETRKPTELELALRCQLIHSRHASNSFAEIRNTAGAKPVDELEMSVDSDIFSVMSDLELAEILTAAIKGKTETKEITAETSSTEEEK